MPTIYTAATFWTIFGVGIAYCVMYFIAFLFAGNMSAWLAYAGFGTALVIWLVTIGQSIYTFAHNEGVLASNLYFYMVASICCGIFMAPSQFER